ncbi:MAG: phosphomethylpyrimidine synthase ThiC [Candidatus Cloacimonetes bacterium]|jgi:phosphomethylpyrimidine synthase|nr:phosphomethylpyrimidine synthase ThiC [Candidatus Cloacimonadota bacterium]MDD4157020.1 phosphomethylpyrimidine synthase ThiC [Candidatus Cloacimonadota bacterium]
MTQWIKAKENQCTEQMVYVAEKENINIKELISLLKKGEVVIPANNRRKFDYKGIGSGMSVKINANIGTSEQCNSLGKEINKMKSAIEFGADAIMDLSTGGDLNQIRKELLSECTVPFGTVPIYAIITELFAADKEVHQMDANQLFDEIENQAIQGVDFMTVHCGLTQENLGILKRNPRTLGMVSRGGSLLKNWMAYHKKENPLYAEFDRLLTIAKKYDITLSLGDALRPGCLADASDKAQIAELSTLGELVKRCKKEGVQVMVEGPGHIPYHEIEMNIKLQKSLCDNAPFYVLGPLTIDNAAGYDHIVGAIGATAAASAGADFLCYLTPAEHLCLPTLDDVKQGVIAFKIAAKSADLARQKKKYHNEDLVVSKARAEFDWKTVCENCLDPELAFKRKEETSPNQEECTMCGKLCAIKVSK